jgi:hypothetical protein
MQLGEQEPSETKDRLNQLLKRASSGDESTVPVLREVLKLPFIVELLGNLATRAKDTLIDKFAGKDLAAREGVSRKLECLRDEHSGATPTPLERLLVDRVVACWLHLHYLEVTYAYKEDMNLKVAMHYQRSIDCAQKRYLSAMKTLALVRKLALPVVQVNIAKEQINVAGPCVAAD